MDVDRSNAVEPAASLFALKASIRRSIEAAGIPYTYIVSNGFAEYFLRNFGQSGATVPPRDKVVVLGDGNIKVIFNKEGDIATYTINAVDDPKTLNKILYMRPPANILSFNEILSLWEKKISKTLEKIYILEDQLLEKIRGEFIPNFNKDTFLLLCFDLVIGGLSSLSLETILPTINCMIARLSQDSK
ncbi:hypothetical protein I3842_01G042900 [Carya illinoinensis]|uniref:NmrA-like domain-containing protein n=1 Tax=Carya illinoinensis TaxID=32201 RepID=A0A922K3D4_CARIL|nr:hypothetical protein I3842_01G042900 [Carya illinoinensis]KAG6729695.1 hypothetical protein I3842_01G042900 [Carya illinoinensis]KAG6729696.1 hypothetical protein I3842_01G042900 [Carya illinoinensis]